MKKEIEELLKSGRTAYSIAKESGIDVTAIQKFMNGQRKNREYDFRYSRKVDKSHQKF